MPQKEFVAITTETHENKLVYINTSAGVSLFNESGITFDKAIEFLFGLRNMRAHNKASVTFVCYAFSRDNEFIFSTMPEYLKDKLFQSMRVKGNLDTLEYEIEQLDDKYYSVDKDTQDFEQVDFDRYVNKLAIAELTEVKYNGYKIKLANGKVLTISKGSHSVSFYDIYGFFKPTPLREIAQTWLGIDGARLDRNSLSDLPIAEVEKLKAYSGIEVNIIQRLAVRLNAELQDNGINLARYHGASAVTSAWLGKYKAKQSFHNYRYRRQTSPELHKAANQAFYGGRAEQFKIGTIKDVNIYDINSAYAYATSYLPVMLRKPRFAQDWKPEPFSLWFCEYDFTSLNPYFGLLPNRESSNFTRYKLKGSGYFWQPEIAFIVQHYPQCINVHHGFTLDYEQAPFAAGIIDLYELRLALQDAGNPLEKVIKLALSSIYGKFCQHNGKGHFYNLFYAGFITSVTRRQLLEATLGYESETICFQTDAIHTTATLALPLSRNLGEYKQTKYDSVIYLDNGVYQAKSKAGETVKTKTRGFRNFDFAAAIAELREKQTYTALAEFFIGHNLHTQNLFTGAHYLEHYKAAKTTAPVTKDKAAARLFEQSDIDLTESYFDSKPVGFYAGRESGAYRKPIHKGTNIALDTIEAGRI